MYSLPSILYLQNSLFFSYLQHFASSTLEILYVLRSFPCCSKFVHINPIQRKLFYLRTNFGITFKTPFYIQESKLRPPTFPILLLFFNTACIPFQSIFQFPIFVLWVLCCLIFVVILCVCVRVRLCGNVVYRCVRARLCVRS